MVTALSGDCPNHASQRHSALSVIRVSTRNVIGRNEHLRALPLRGHYGGVLANFLYPDKITTYLSGFWRNSAQFSYQSNWWTHPKSHRNIIAASEVYYCYTMSPSKKEDAEGFKPSTRLCCVTAYSGLVSAYHLTLQRVTHTV
jgi:hypothetical protein